MNRESTTKVYLPYHVIKPNHNTISQWRFVSTQETSPEPIVSAITRPLAVWGTTFKVLRGLTTEPTLRWLLSLGAVTMRSRYFDWLGLQIILKLSGFFSFLKHVLITPKCSFFLVWKIKPRLIYWNTVKFWLLVEHVLITPQNFNSVFNLILELQILNWSAKSVTHILPWGVLLNMFTELISQYTKIEVVVGHYHWSVWIFFFFFLVLLVCLICLFSFSPPDYQLNHQHWHVIFPRNEHVHFTFRPTLSSGTMWKSMNLKNLISRYGKRSHPW